MGAIGRPLLCLALALPLLLFAVFTFDASPRRPLILGGTAFSELLAEVPLLNEPQARLQLRPAIQLLSIAASNVIGGHDETFSREELLLSVQGASAISDSQDAVSLQWLQRKGGDPLPDDAPLLFLLPGLGNDRNSLPGQSLYAHLHGLALRVVVYEKRGVGAGKGKLRVPVVSFYGHPSDLRSALGRITYHYPHAPIHIVSYSAGNGLLGGFLRTYAEEVQDQVRSTLMLMGGEDYNKACVLRADDWMDRAVESRMVQFMKNHFFRSNWHVLRNHNATAFDAALAGDSFCDLYHATRAFTGLDDPVEAEESINGFRDGSAWLTKQRVIPSVVVYTEDDPVSHHLAQSWRDNYAASSHFAAAVFEHGSHCACYNADGSRWLDTLVVQWVQAAQKLYGAGTASHA